MVSAMVSVRFSGIWDRRLGLPILLHKRELQNNELPLYKWFFCEVDIEHDAG